MPFAASIKQLSAVWPKSASVETRGQHSSRVAQITFLLQRESNLCTMLPNKHLDFHTEEHFRHVTQITFLSQHEGIIRVRWRKAVFLSNVRGAFLPPVPNVISLVIRGTVSPRDRNNI